MVMMMSKIMMMMLIIYEYAEDAKLAPLCLEIIAWAGKLLQKLVAHCSAIDQLPCTPVKLRKADKN